ncbi:DNA damage response protein [Malassezia pachydermatis]
MKARGLTRLRWYCQICSKACRDANGYKCHIESESHMRQLAAATGEGGQRAGKVVHDYSSQFQREFIALLSRRFGTRRVLANQVYQEYIQDRHHVHMNATRWVSLSEFVKFLGRAGIVKVEGSEMGWFISWIDNSATARARQDAIKKQDRAKMDDEQRARRELDEQIRRAQEQTAAHAAPEPAPTPLRHDEGIVRFNEHAPVKLSISLTKPTTNASDTERPAATASTSSSTTSASLQSTSGAPSSVFSMRVNPLKAASQASVKTTNPLKGDQPTSAPKKRPPPTHMGAAERIMMEEKARKSQSGPVMQPGVKRSRF